MIAGEDVPSPQSIVAVKSAGVTEATLSVNVAIRPWMARPLDSMIASPVEVSSLDGPDDPTTTVLVARQIRRPRR